MKVEIVQIEVNENDPPFTGAPKVEVLDDVDIDGETHVVVAFLESAEAQFSHGTMAVSGEKIQLGYQLSGEIKGNAMRCFKAKFVLPIDNASQRHIEFNGGKSMMKKPRIIE